MMTPDYELIKMIAEGPESDIAPEMAAILKEITILDAMAGISTEKVRTTLQRALDYGAYGGLASEFIMRVLDLEWRRLGGIPSDPAPWREEMT
jgi:hypothetical protein